jgi:two-component system, chemotaxis family, response regulator Rcp1
MNGGMQYRKLIEILLVEDNPGDVRLTREAMRDGRVLNRMSVVADGIEAMDFLHRRGQYVDAPRPDLILLDLNLPRKDGREVLSEIKRDPELKCIPVVILTTSEAEQDILKTYELHANCYITKPVDLEQFLRVARVVEDFWFTTVTLPGNRTSAAL